MKINAYRVVCLPEAIEWKQGSSDKEPTPGTIIWCWGVGKRKIHAVATQNALSFAGAKANTVHLNSIPDTQRNNLLHQILDSYFNRQGLNNHKSTFYYPKGATCPFPPKYVDRTYINIGFEYKLEDIADNLYLVILPKNVYTEDGISYNPEFSKSVHYKFIDNPNVHLKYSKYCELFNDIVKNFGDRISIDTGTKKPLDLTVANSIDETQLEVISEPNIDFGGQRTHTYPAAGIKKFHPLDYNLSFPNRPNDIKVAYVGTFFSRELLNTMVTGEKQGKYPFPGFNKIYKAKLDTDNRRVELSDGEINSCSSIEEITDLLKQKVLQIKNNGFDIDVCLIELVPQWERFFTGQDINLHDYIKVAFWKERIPTQIITKKAVIADSSSTYANIALGIYVTSGGKPWRLEDQFKDTAFIGISFGESKKDKRRLIGIAEIFDEYGHSIATSSLTIVEKPLDERIREREKHLKSKQFEHIVNSLLQQYRDKMNGNTPSNIIIHKTTGFNDNEKSAIRSFSETAIQFTLIYINAGHNNLWRMITNDYKEPSRGLYWKITAKKALLYTSGVLSNQSLYMLPNAPLPMIIEKQNESSFTIDDVCNQVILLTKLNWNSVNSYEREPVTLSHSRKLVNLLRAGLDPSDIPMDLRYFL